MKITQRNPLVTTHFYLFLIIHLTISTTADLLYIPSENILINCGFPSNTTASSNDRNWITDIGSNFMFSAQPNTSTTSEASKQSISIPQIPYKTARLFYSQLNYSFSVSPGPKFVRLYFYPDSYSGLNQSDAFFTVSSGQFTLLSNFSPSLTTDYLNQDYLIKEFCINIEGHTLDITFTPSHGYGFVNGIEIVSMPPNLYIRDELLPFVGQLNWFEFDNYTALETVYRLNVGGNEIPPENDTGIFRTWFQDSHYIFGGSYGETSKKTEVGIHYPSTVPPYTAPEDLYRTARVMSLDSEINIHKQLTWSFSLDTGFFYLFRFHLCETRDQITKPNQIVFYISIGNETSGDRMDVIKRSGGNGVPVYVDYVGMVVAEGNYRGKQDLWISLYPCIEANPMYYDAILNGLEIFKLNHTDGNLAGSNPPPTNPDRVHSGTPSRRLILVVGSVVAGGAIAICLVCFLIYRYGRSLKDKSWVSLANNNRRYLSLVEITNSRQYEQVG
ncbi:receptor-like protein kinase FERONIA [Telopea speciosissima]|uniref:receptor-like protein kinase FERONIA n=1 Tax=Telopea speciosissima TaxID=54955 RepID=UPI001CC74CB2|nr:receptor-like protein kinase FERONIA [Telopea speciosissima]